MPVALPDLFNEISGAGHVALAVSGGSDSMALLRLADEGSFPRLTILTVDHGLRPESAVDIRQVGGWCTALGLSHVSLRWEGPKPQTGIQAKARVARYDLMAQWCRDHGANWLLTAHTMDDQAETVLMRLARTTSFDSLSGIPRIGNWQGVKLFRPLIGLRREALRGMLREMRQPWIDDPSNAEERFERVRIRKALPVLEGLGITAEGLGRFADEARAVSEGLAGAANDWCAVHAKHFNEGFVLAPLAALKNEPRAIRSRILGQLIARYGAGHRPEPAELSHLCQWLDTGDCRRTLGGALIGRRKDHVIIGREPGRIALEATVAPGVWDHRFDIAAPPGSLVRAAGTGFARRPDLPGFVQQGLPAITLPDGQVVVPHLGVGTGAKARFRP